VKATQEYYHIKGGTVYKPAPRCGAVLPEGYTVKGWVRPQRRITGPFRCAICPRGSVGCIHTPPSVEVEPFLWLEYGWGDRPASRKKEDVCPECRAMAAEVVAWDQKSRALCRAELPCRKTYPCREHGEK
jgi:hypothetical protein